MPKYIKRIGSKGHYRYFYTKEQLDKYNKTNSKKQEDEISIPEFRNFRVKNKGINSAILYPYKVGTKFTDKEINYLKKWAKDNNLYVNSASPTKIHLIRTDTNPLDLSLHGMDGVKREEYKKRKEEQKREWEEKRNEREKEYHKLPQSKWIDTIFGKDFTNSYNRLRIAEFLENDKKRPENIAPTWKWADGLKKLNALKDDGTIMWEKVKEAYNKTKGR